MYKKSMLLFVLIIMSFVAYAVSINIDNFVSQTNPFNITYNESSNVTNLISIPLSSYVSSFNLTLRGYNSTFDKDTDLPSSYNLYIYYPMNETNISGPMEDALGNNDIETTAPVGVNFTGQRNTARWNFSDNYFYDANNAFSSINTANNYTITMFVNASTMVEGTVGVLYSSNGAGNKLVNRLYLNTTGIRGRTLWTGGPATSFSSLITNFTNQEWIFIFYQFNATTDRSYRVGIVNDTGIYYGQLYTTGAELDAAEQQTFFQRFNGTADEVSFYLDYLSEDELLSIASSRIYPNNISIEVGNRDNDYEYNLPNVLNDSVNATINITKLNDILASNCTCTDCSITSTNCNIPLTFYSGSVGIVNVNSTNVSYSFGVDSCTDSFNIPSNATAYNVSFYDEDGNKRSLAHQTAGNYDLDTIYNHNFSTSGTVHSYELCTYPNWANIYSDIFIDYDNNSYNTYQTFLDNTTQYISLYTQNETSRVTFTVVDTTTALVENAFIHILEWTPATNSYTTTEILKTDSTGQAVGNIKLTTTFYRFIIQFEGVTRLIEPETGGIKLYSTSRTFTINTEDTQWYDDYDTVIDTEATMTFNVSGTNSYVFTWVNSDGTQIEGCLKVLKHNRTGTYTMSDSCTTSASSSIVYAITPSNCDEFTATGYFNFGSNTYTANINNNPLSYEHDCLHSFKGVKGPSGDKEVLFFAWMIIAALALMGIPFPELSFILTSVGMIGVIALGMWDISWVFITPIIIIGVIYMFKGNRK